MVRSASVATTSAALIPTITAASACSPLSPARAPNTMPISPDDRIAPTYCEVRNSPAALPACSPAPARTSPPDCPP